MVALNDVHLYNEKLPFFAYQLQEEREKDSDLLFFGTGDIFCGSDQWKYNEPSKVMVRIFNELGCNAVCLGNHEFDRGFSHMMDYFRDARFSILCTNFNQPENTTPSILKYKILEKKGVKIGIIGFIETLGNGDTIRGHAKGFENTEVVDALKILDNYRGLRQQCDILIVLSHLGFEHDKQLAQAFPEADAILGAHSHTVLHEGYMENGVLISQAGYALSHYARLEFVVESGKVVSKSAVAIPCQTEHVIPDIARIVESGRKAKLRELCTWTNRQVFRVIGVPLNHPLVYVTFGLVCLSCICVIVLYRRTLSSRLRNWGSSDK